MAIAEETFYNVLGEEINRTNIVTEMIKFYLLKLQAGETRITDFNEGSEIRGLLEAYAVDGYTIKEDQNEVTKVAFVETAEGEWLDKHGGQPDIGLERDLGHESVGMVTFTIPDAVNEELIIPEGTVLSDSNTELEYITDTDATIPVGETSTSVGASCLTTGSDGNCNSNSIDTISDDYVNINGLTVTNNDPFTSGTDYEEDFEYRERLLDFKRKNDFGSLAYYERLGAEVDGVHDVKIIDDDNDYTSTVLVNAMVKPCPDSVLLDVLTEFTKTENLILNHNFLVSKPTYVEVNLSFDLTVTSLLDEDVLTSLFNNFFDGGSDLDGLTLDGVLIGESVSKDDLLNLLNVFMEITSATITNNGLDFTVLSVESDEVLQLTSISFNQTIVGE